MEINRNFLGGVGWGGGGKPKKPSMGGVWIFSGNAHYCLADICTNAVHIITLQFYSAKMGDLMHDGVSCVVSFLDFHNSCDVVPLSSLRPFPIIAWVSTRI